MVSCITLVSLDLLITCIIRNQSLSTDSFAYWLYKGDYIEPKIMTENHITFAPKKTHNIFVYLCAWKYFIKKQHAIVLILLFDCFFLKHGLIVTHVHKLAVFKTRVSSRFYGEIFVWGWILKLMSCSFVYSSKISI